MARDARPHSKGESFAMKKKEITRRELLQASTALGFATAVPVSFLGLSGCSSKPAPHSKVNALQELAAPAPPGSLTPRVSARPGGGVILTWLEPKEDGTSAFRFSLWQSKAWSQPATIADGLFFSRDRASAPGVIALSNHNLIAYWSQKPARKEQSGNEIELYMAASTDGGEHWSSPTLVNRSGAQPGEDNAYASAAALDESQAALIWLDGRNWEKQKRVQLMSRTVRSDGTMSEATILDPDTCTCCSTALVRTGSGLLAAYRGHTPDNIRDISFVRNVTGGWSPPRIAHPDHWHIEACPVNGPHLDTDGERAALIWFSAPQDQPLVRLAFSQNGGADFASPLRIDTGLAIGRAQVVLLPGNSAVAFWLENDSGTARILERRIRNNTVLDAPFELSRGGNLGYPHAVRADDGILLTWTEKDTVSRVRVGFLKAG
jgi:hypothetical protein